VPSLSRLPLFDRLRDARSVLVAGAGGGFDIYAGLSLAFALEAEGKDVHLANLSFSSLADPDFWIAPGLASVGPDSLGDDDYFPERTLARWLTAHNRPQPIYAFAATGVKPLRSIYTTLADKLGLDAVILVDGGTDILMRGDEARIGTPEEDMASLAALHGLEDIPIRILASVGFGIEAHHGVNHVQVLENIAGLIRAGSYLGAFSIPPDSPEGRSYVDAVADAAAATPAGPSIVNGHRIRRAVQQPAHEHLLHLRPRRGRQPGQLPGFARRHQDPCGGGISHRDIPLRHPDPSRADVSSLKSCSASGTSTGHDRRLPAD
jgi:hypothetical protein